MKSLALALLSIFIISVNSFADGCVPGDPCYEDSVRVDSTKPAPAHEMPVAATKTHEETEVCGWGNRVAVGAPVWFFSEQNTEVGAGAYFDLYPCNRPLNLRVGAEITHMNLSESSAQSAAEWPGKAVEVTFVRVPFAVEYVVPLAEKTDLYLGGGPDIINTVNDVSDTSVGLHLSARLGYNFAEHLGVALEAGYMWGEIETDEGDDVSLDNAFVIPTLVYTF